MLPLSDSSGVVTYTDCPVSVKKIQLSGEVQTIWLLLCQKSMEWLFMMLLHSCRTVSVLALVLQGASSYETLY